MQPPALQLAMEFFVLLGRQMHDTVADISPDDLQRTTAVIRLMITAVTNARIAAAKTLSHLCPRSTLL